MTDSTSSTPSSFEGWALFLDDEREPSASVLARFGERLHVARSSSAAIDLMARLGCPVWISLDHDLGGPDSARSAVAWMIERDLDEPGWIPDRLEWGAHSQNPVGREHLLAQLGGYLRWREQERQLSRSLKP